MVLIWKERSGKAPWQNVKTILFYQWHGWCKHQVHLPQFSPIAIGRWNSTYDHQVSLGEIYQHMLIALEKLCNHRKFFSKMEKVHSKLKDSYKRKDLQIKCYEKSCDCLTQKKSHSRTYPLKKRYQVESKKKIFWKKKWKFLRRKQLKGRNSKVCFVCRKSSHFAKNYPKEEKVAKLLKQAHIHAKDTPFSNLESLYLLDDEYSPQALMVIAYSTTEKDLDSSSSDASDLEIQTIYTS